MLGEFLNRSQARKILAGAPVGKARQLKIDGALTAAHYDRQPYRITHRLGENPLLHWPALQALCRRRGDLVGVRRGEVRVESDISRSFEEYPLNVSQEEVIADPIAHRAYLLVTNPERDEAYRPLIESLVGEIAQATRALESRMTWYSCYVFISTQSAITPYHQDRELNYLLQIEGTKHVDLWDPRDDAIMTPAERDELLAYGSSQRPTYRPACEARAQRFDLEPGQGVHHPFIAPHLVTTSSGFSISLAVTYRTTRTEVLTSAHRVNHRMRTHGWIPRPVGQAPLVDRSKAMAISAWRQLRRFVK